MPSSTSVAWTTTGIAMQASSVATWREFFMFLCIIVSLSAPIARLAAITR